MHGSILLLPLTSRTLSVSLSALLISLKESDRQRPLLRPFFAFKPHAAVRLQVAVDTKLIHLARTLGTEYEHYLRSVPRYLFFR